MEERDENEPIIIDLQKSHALRQPKYAFLLFVSSAVLFAILLIAGAAFYVSQSAGPPQQPSPPADPNVPVTAAPTATPTPSPPPPTPTIAPTPTPLPGRLTLFSIPQNAEVIIDGTVLQTPLHEYELDPGTYTLKFSYDDHLSQHTLTIRAGETTQYTHRFEGFGSLKIDTTTSGSEILINGKPAGRSPLLVEGLPPGTYTIVARKVGYATAEKQVSLEQGEHQELLITIKPLDAAQPSSRTSPPDRPLHPSERLQQ
ncbi:PEGA domain-containing protein [candidate division KSB3 bacterium]|uniref:PEGA domain-containing protein n=1 Tax=candidate division KSB3 bacterium TaxID=2044937 RepID=A0A9D5JVL1_9BACT|nr:PEGA domain-containing protein [candidate division KSB3 bacterium]MBD3325082.1 PEGA domain-containing protein [candidate division KSB3 bacterium]